MKWFKTIVYSGVLIAGLYVFLIMNSFSWRNLISEYSLLFLCAGLTFSFAHFSLKEQLQAFGDALGFSTLTVLKKNRDKDILIFKSLRDYTLLAGAAGSGIALIQLLSELDDMALLIKGGSLVLLSLLYPLLLRFFIISPLKINLDYQLNKNTWDVDYV